MYGCPLSQTYCGHVPYTMECTQKASVVVIMKTVINETPRAIVITVETTLMKFSDKLKQPKKQTEIQVTHISNHYNSHYYLLSPPYSEHVKN